MEPDKSSVANGGNGAPRTPNVAQVAKKRYVTVLFRPGSFWLLGVLLLISLLLFDSANLTTHLHKFIFS